MPEGSIVPLKPAVAFMEKVLMVKVAWIVWDAFTFVNVCVLAAPFEELSTSTSVMW